MRIKVRSKLKMVLSSAVFVSLLAKPSLTEHFIVPAMMEKKNPNFSDWLNDWFSKATFHWAAWEKQTERASYTSKEFRQTLIIRGKKLIYMQINSLWSPSSCSQVLSKWRIQFFPSWMSLLPSETLTEASSTSFPQPPGPPTQCSSQPAPSFSTSSQWLRGGRSSPAMPPQCRLLAPSHNSFIFSATYLSLAGRSSAHSRSYLTNLPPLFKISSLLGGLPKTWWHFSLLGCYLQQPDQPNRLIIPCCYL